MKKTHPLPLPIGRGVATFERCSFIPYLVVTDRVLIVVLATGLALVTGSLGCEFFRNEERDLLTGLSADGDFGKAGEILAHITNEGSFLDCSLCGFRCSLDGIGQNVVP